MWIFTTIGFFSAVQKPGESVLTVRARVKGDLEALRERYMPGLTEPSDHGGTDYPWRSRIDHASFAEGLAALARDVDYSNFKSAVAATQGAGRAHVYGDVWRAMLGVETLGAKQRAARPTASRTPGGRRSAYGGVVLNREGKVLVREPTGHYGGYVWTFAKGSPVGAETPEQAAMREVREETGVEARIVQRIDRWFEGDTSDTRFFLMELVEDHGDFDRKETAAVRWASFEEADRLVSETTSETGRARDRAVLKEARRLFARREPTRG